MSFLFTPNTNIRNSNTDPITNTAPLPVQVISTAQNAVHSHLTEVGTSGILNVPYLPVYGNVNIFHANSSIITADVPLDVRTNTESIYSAPWDLQVSRGKIPGVIQVNVFGYGNNVTSASYTSLWEDGVYEFPAAASSMNVFSSSASDTGAIVTISGLDANYNMISETLTLAGTSNVATTKQFLRINSFNMTTPNTSQNTNVGTITLKNAANSAMMSPGVGRMQNSWYSIPAGYSLYVRSINIFSGETKSGATPTWFFYRVRNHNNITGMHYNVLTTSFQNEYKVQRSNPVRYTEKSDIEWQFSSSDTGPHTVGIILEALLISDSAL